MIKYPAVFVPVLILICFEASSQKLKKADKAVISRLTEHVQYLSDDKLEGRRAGSNGEQLAAEYISNQFKKILTGIPINERSIAVLVYSSPSVNCLSVINSSIGIMEKPISSINGRASLTTSGSWPKCIKIFLPNTSDNEIIIAVIVQRINPLYR